MPGLARLPAPPLAAALAGLILAAAGAGTVHAVTITVDTDSDADAVDGACSLREAILAANDDVARNECPAGAGADRIAFAPAVTGIITLTDHLPAITAPLAIRGPGAFELALDGDQLYRPLKLDSPDDDGWVLVEDLSVTHGRNPAPEFGGGGALVAPGETAIFRRVHFVGNRSDNAGGGLLLASAVALGSSTSLIDCLVADNVAEGAASGGGLATNGTGDGVVRIVGSTFVGNRADDVNGVGGAMLVGRATVTLDSSTLSGNVASREGGGIFVLSTAMVTTTLIVRHSTIADNTTGDGLTSGGGGGIAVAPSTDSPLLLTLENSVVAGNTDLVAPEQPDVYCSAAPTLAGSGTSFLGSNEGCAAVFPAGTPNAAGDYVGTAAAPLLPLLDVLGNHGGATPTHRPSFMPPSPLLDHGTCPAAVTDQRSYGEPATGLRAVDLPAIPDGAGSDGCDIGAFEVLAVADSNPLIYADGFEPGHTLLWSAEVP